VGQLTTGTSTGKKPILFRIFIRSGTQKLPHNEKVQLRRRTSHRRTTNTIISYGSEVRPIHQLEVLLHHHPNFTRFKHNTNHGILYPIKDLDEDTRIRPLKQQLEKGNHKSTNNKDDKIHVTKAMETDVVRGFGFILTQKCVERLKQAEIYPLGLQHQMTINERGENIPKKSVYHDLSNNRKQGLSIN